MKYLLVVLFILVIQNVVAVCEDNQIDVNTASQEELIKLYGIGEVKFERYGEAFLELCTALATPQA